MQLAARLDEARQAWNAGDLDRYLDLYDERIQLHGHSPEPMDKASVVAFYLMIHTTLTEPGSASPPLVFHDVLVDGDRCCCRFTMSGVHA